MAMNFIKGLVAPAAFPGQQPQQPPQQAYDPNAPPIGGAPNPYGVQPMMQPVPQQPAYQQQPAAYQAPMEWSVGTKTQGSAGNVSGGSAGGPSAEARVAQLQHDVESLALFARTLLTMLEEAKIVTRAQFDATKNRLDMLDGKLDDK